MRGRGELSRQNNHAARPEIGVVHVQNVLVEGSEPVRQRKTRRELEHRVSEVVVGVECAVAGGGVEVAGAVKGRRAACHPDAGQTTVRRCVVDGNSGQRCRVIADEPAVIGRLVFVRRPREINHSVGKGKGRSLVLVPWVKGNRSAGRTETSVARSGYRSADRFWPGKLLIARYQIQSVQSL